MEKILAALAAEKERRFHERFMFNGDAMVFLGKDTGAILDLSQTGLAVRIAGLQNDSMEISRLDIFFAEPRFYLPNLPVCLVNEFAICSDTVTCLMQIKRLGIKFGALGQDQRALLEQFIANHTTLTNW